MILAGFVLAIFAVVIGVAGELVGGHVTRPDRRLGTLGRSRREIRALRKNRADLRRVLGRRP